ncbi:MAG: hypothetical protein WB992_13070, partial [Bryobacteraceae bacterium]
MQLSDLLPTSEQLGAVQGIEKSLLERRRNGKLWGSALAIATAVLQVGLLLSHWVKLPEAKKGQPLDWHAFLAILRGPEGIVVCLLLAAAAVYFTFRYTGLLFKESKEPFRYTFCIEPFTRIAGTPGDRFSLSQEDLLKLLHYDLMERLNRRIRRLSLLEHAAKTDDAGKKGETNLTAHIHVEGEYTIREENDGRWILQVLPRVRIGPENNPFTLAFAVRYSLDLEEEAEAGSKKSAVLRVEQYEQLAERVYSSVATEIYRQIKRDVENKIGLFPTSYLRAVARYYEARDFENSNTIDSYDRAIELYESAKESFSVSKFLQIRLWFAKFSLERRLLPFVDRMLWSWVRPAMRAQAVVWLGHSRCLIYRRIVSELAGRKRNPLFEIREELADARAGLAKCYNSVMPREDLKFRVEEKSRPMPGQEGTALSGVLEFPEDTAFQPRRMDIYRSLREELCEAFAVSTLGYSSLADFKQAKEFLKIAEALNPREDANVALILLAKPSVEGDLEQRIAYLRRAKDIAPDSEIIGYRLAVSLDNLACGRDEIDPYRVDALRRAYELVLKINPGNVACLIGQGYLSWLIKDFEHAERAYSVADDLQEMVSQTFVGDLKYGHARVDAERAAQFLEEINDERLKRNTDELENARKTQCLKNAAKHIGFARRAYEEAVAADPAVAAGYSASTQVMNTYYAFIGPKMLNRYAEFMESLSNAQEIVRQESSQGFAAEFPIESLDRVLSYARNDYGNACLNYFCRSKLRIDRTGDRRNLLEAIDQLKQAAEGAYPNVIAQYNLSIAYSWRQDSGDTDLQLQCLDKVLERFPSWLEAVRTRSSSRFRDLGLKDSNSSQQLRNLKAEKEKLVKRIKEPAESPDGKALEQGTTDEQHRQLAELEAKITEARRERAQVSTMLEREADEALEKVVANTLLRPMKEQLKRSEDMLPKLQSFLDDDSIQWSRLGDSEVLALGAWAEALSRLPQSEAWEASVCLSKHILTKYYPEDYSTLVTLLYAMLQLPLETGIVPEELLPYEETLFFTLDRAEKSDPLSSFVPYLRKSYENTRASLVNNSAGDRLFDQKKYTEASNQYKLACDLCDEEPLYHSNLSLALERTASQAPPPPETEVRNLRAQALAELKQACDLDPGNRDYRDRLVSLRSRDWVSANGLDSALNRYAQSYLLELQFSEALLPDLINQPDGTLKDGLQKKISSLRTRLKQDTGVVLPPVT